MKGIKFIAVLALLIGFTFACEKEEPQVLSDFIVGGEWVYDQIEQAQTLTFLGKFSADGTYELTLTDGTQYIPFSGDYSVDDDTNVLTLDEPDFEGTGDVEQAYFDVQWTEGVEQMVWTQVGDPTNILTWTR